MLQIEKALAKVESMIEPDTDIGTEYEYSQAHKARYFEILRIFNPKPQNGISGCRYDARTPCFSHEISWL